jgi:hypothetical protein|tara:strand:- start:270 stop:539 length:270 start_codon:yes stop_codon:yes gene_type:complete
MTDSSIFNEIKTANEKQIGGSHYKQFFIQPWTFIRKNKLNPLQANIIKYVCRYLSKGKAIEDLEKIKHYCDLEINHLKEEEKNDKKRKG